MNVLAWLLGLSILILLMVKAVDFHKATVCRQVAWLKSTELKTRSLLTEQPARERASHLSCKLLLLRDEENISWQRLPSLRHHSFNLSLNGEL